MTRHRKRVQTGLGLLLLIAHTSASVYGSDDPDVVCNDQVPLEQLTSLLSRDSSLEKQALALCLERAERLLDVLPDNAQKIDVLTLMSHHFGRKGESERALVFADQAVDIAISEDDEIREGWSRYQRAVAKFYLSETEVALLEARLAASQFEDVGNAIGAAKAYTLVGAIHRSRSEYEEAVLAHEEALSNSLLVNDANGIARARNNIGLVYWNLGEFDAAREYFESILAYYRDNGPSSSLVTLLNNLGLILVEVNEIEKALVYLDEGLTLLARADDPRSRAMLLNNKAFAYGRQGDLQGAMALYAEGAAIRESLGDWWRLSRSLTSMAAISRQLGDTDTALATYERALQLAESVDARSEMADISQTLSTIYEELGRSEDALRNLQLAYRTRESINDTEALKLIGILESERDLAESALLLTQSSQRQTWLIGIAVFLLIVTAQLAVFARSRSRSLATVQSHVRELELAKALLEESELRYRSLFNDAVVAKYVIDLETRRVLEANEPAIQLSSIPASGLVDLPIAYLAPEWLRESMVNLDRLGDEDLFLTVTWFDADADRRYADICFKAVAMKGKECVIVAVHDSTEEKRWQSNR